MSWRSDQRADFVSTSFFRSLLMNRLLFALVALLGIGCAASTGLFPIRYEFVDIPSERRIELHFRNDLGHFVCLSPEFWPNQAGKINQASGAVFLLVGTQRFPIEDFNTGYCRDCALRIAPDESVTASVRYESFGVPDSLVNEEKRIEFLPKAYRCRGR
jgi:hypothetical protein